jgi:hypothetical protein
VACFDGVDMRLLAFNSSHLRAFESKYLAPHLVLVLGNSEISELTDR